MAHILVIDDDVQICDMLTGLLEYDNHLVTVAHNGQEGLRLFQETSPDLIITDIIMPEKDGLEIISLLQRLDSSVPIVAMSGGGRHSSSSDNLSLAKCLGANAVLTKPFTKDELYQAIVTALTQNGTDG